MSTASDTLRIPARASRTRMSSRVLAGNNVGYLRQLRVSYIRQLRVGGIGEPQAVRRGEFPGHAADGQRIAAVRGHRDVQHMVGEPGVRHEVSTKRGVRRQHQDAGVILPDAELGRRADHPLRHPPVGLLRRDLEAPGQRRAGQRQRDLVADVEIDRATDHVVRLTVTGGDLAVPHRLLEPGQLLDPSDLGHDNAGDVVPDLVHSLHFQAGRGEPPGNLSRLGARPVTIQPGFSEQP
jgi:hypothetical protein